MSLSSLLPSIRPRLCRIVQLGVCVLVLAVSQGCSCWQDPLGRRGSKSPTLEEMERRREELEGKDDEKPNFEISRLAVLPTDDSPTGSRVKPGHWFNAIQTMKANNFDLNRGDLDAQCVDNTLAPLRLPGTIFELRSSRPVSLPKGQQKHFDVLLFATQPSKGNKINFQTRLRARGGGRELESKLEPTSTMKPYQHFIVVLAERPDNYQFVKTLRSVKLVRSKDDFSAAAPFDYYVQLPKGTRRVDLPSHPLTWTNTAYVIWDDFNPAVLSLSQQRAMIDWLHWGGQLIVSGPRTLDLLAGSAFADYLPAQAGETSTLSDDQIHELNENWSYDEAGQMGQLNLGTAKRPLTVELKLTARANHLANTAGLVAERAVGRGRIVVTGFALPHEVFLAWESFDTFFNACLLRRPPRSFEYAGTEAEIVDRWSGLLDRSDARLTSQLRYFSRDAMMMTARREPPVRASENNQTIRRNAAVAATADVVVATSVMAEADAVDDEQEQIETEGPPAIHRGTTRTFGLIGFGSHEQMGVAAWNDTSDASKAAKAALDQSAGIDVPSAGFIARVLGVYLLILVPVNWALFRLAGRVEWAWVAVPVIAIGGTLAVLRVAQLDIGFARSRTEIAIVETQPEYPRAHLTRYVGLYSSLSSRYQIHGEDDSTLIQPLASSQPINDRRVALYQGDDVALTGFRVLSNSTGLIHGEQMVDLGGAFALVTLDEQMTVENQTDYDLMDAAVVRRTMDGTPQVAWVGDLASKQQQSLEFQRLNSSRVDFPQWRDSSALGFRSADGELNIREIVDLAVDPKRLGPGETVLIGWKDLIIPGMTIRPAASQVIARTVFVAQLAHAARPQARRDVNSYAVQLRSKLRDSENATSTY